MSDYFKTAKSWGADPDGKGFLLDGEPLGYAVAIEGPMVERIEGTDALHILWVPIFMEGPCPRAGLVERAR